MRGNKNLQPGILHKDACYSRKRWTKVQYLANQFCQRWIKKFLPNLLEKQQWFDVKENLKVYDIVLVVENLQQLSKWVMGKVLKTFPDTYDLVQTVLVKTQANVHR